MTKVIYKYQLKVADSQDISMPLGAKILTVQMQHDEPHVWAEIDVVAPVGQRRINLVGTGWTYGNYVGEYVATLQAGPFVWHVFDAGYCA